MTESKKATVYREVREQPSLAVPANKSVRFSSRPFDNRPQSVELHIEELVLHGFKPVSRYTIGNAVERELRRLITEQGPSELMMQDIDVANINVGALDLSAESNSESIGTKLARIIFRGLA